MRFKPRRMSCLSDRINKSLKHCQLRSPLHRRILQHQPQGARLSGRPMPSPQGGCGFTHHQSTVCASPPPITAADATATVWDAFAGRPDCANDITDFLQQLDTKPRLRSAAMLRTLGRVREELEAMPEQSALDARVCVSLQDALVLMSQVMSRIR